MTIVEQVKQLVATLDTVELLTKARDELRAPFNNKIRMIEKTQREEKRRVREEAAEKLCLALRPGEKVVMCEHGFLDIFNPGGGNERFYQADATVHVYQPRKKILWLNVKVRKGNNKTLSDECRPFRLHEVANNNVRRRAE